MSEDYRYNDEILTTDGRLHRFLQWSRDRQTIIVKSATGKAGKAYRIKPNDVVANPK